MTLPSWNELTVNERRSTQRLYERIRAEVNGTATEVTPELYYFKSYADAEGETEWGEGTVEPTGISEKSKPYIVKSAFALFGTVIEA